MTYEHRPAFPNDIFEGMTIREFYVGIIINGLMSNPDLILKVGDTIQTLAIRETDALLAELNKTSSNG